MNTNSGSHEWHSDIPRWAAAAGQHKLWAPRWAMRLLCARRQTINDGGPDATTADVPWPVGQRVPRDYHAGTLAEARRTSEEMVRAGFNTGTVPYGYRAQRVRVTPAGRRARWRNRLVVEPVEAATVKMIFAWRGDDGLTIAGIRQRLVAARYPAPLDPETGQPGTWTHAIITAILRNPKYLGRQVWGRRHHGRRASPQVWVWSSEWAHAPIVSADEYIAANHRTRLATALPVTEGPVAVSRNRRTA